MLRALLFAACVAVAAAATPPVWAASAASAYNAAPQMRVSLDQAVALARNQQAGRVVGAETRSRRGRIVHEVKILTAEGTVRVIRVDGETGRVSR
ncbi:MAG: hypothetical protein LC632_05580 [Xanthomonadaceae bacterium]|nr:hypothetical protein [Xanthomonadaceae bacterium]